MIDTWAFSWQELEEFDERAGVYEFDAGMTREQSEIKAYQDMQRREHEEQVNYDE